MIDEGNRLFADTRHANSWFMYHDALPQWWEKGAQEHIKSRGMEHRQWRARGPTNNLIARYYRDKLMGDSPELMPLDSTLFGDQIEWVAWLVVSTAMLPVKEQYSMATPDEAWRTMVDAWTQVPESRIVDDIDRFTLALNAIIEAKGAYVADMDLRKGHRALMQRLVRGGARRTRNEDGTVARVEAGIKAVLASWEGLTKGMASGCSKK